MTTNDRDLLIRLAIAPAPDLVAPAELGDGIYRAILRTPQRRGVGVLGRRLPWLTSPSLVGLVALLALLGIGLLIVALARPPAVPLLTMYHGGPARTGVMPGPGPTGTPAIAWDVQRSGGFAFNTMPLVSDRRVLVADDSGVIAALDEGTGTTLWEVPAGGAIKSSPAVFGDEVAVGTDGGDLLALRVADGMDAWRTPLDGTPVSASVMIAEGVLFAGTEGGRLFALDPATGRITWSVEVGGATTRGAAYDAGILYVGGTGGHVVAIDTATHRPRWTAELGTGEVGTPAVGGGRVLIARGVLAPDGPHDLVALRVSDGSIEWTFASPAGGQAHLAVLTGQTTYAYAEDGSVYALDPATGGVRWTATTGGPIGAPPALVGDTLYVACDDWTVRALNANTGAELWRIEVKGRPSAPAVIDGRVFVGTNLGLVVAIRGASTSP
jgi:outer membrane protein assembly factor BamB